MSDVDEEIEVLRGEHNAAVANGLVLRAAALGRQHDALVRQRDEDARRAQRDAELDEIKACAEGALQGWLGGYTDPFPDGEQRRVVQLHTDREGSSLWRFEAASYRDVLTQPRVVRVTMLVEEVEAP